MTSNPSIPIMDWSGSDSIAFDLTGDGTSNNLRIRLHDGSDSAWLDSPWVTLQSTGQRHVVLPFTQFTLDYNGAAFDWHNVSQVALDLTGSATGTHTIPLFADIHPVSAAERPKVLVAGYGQASDYNPLDMTLYQNLTQQKFDVTWTWAERDAYSFPNNGILSNVPGSRRYRPDCPDQPQQWQRSVCHISIELRQFGRWSPNHVRFLRLQCH